MSDTGIGAAVKRNAGILLMLTPQEYDAVQHVMQTAERWHTADGRPLQTDVGEPAALIVESLPYKAQIIPRFSLNTLWLMSLLEREHLWEWISDLPLAWQSTALLEIYLAAVLLEEHDQQEHA